MAWTSKYFKRSEFQCTCGCGDANINLMLLPILDDVREHFGAPVIINSAKRCVKHNKKVGGAEFSQHLLGNAADIVIKGASPDDVHAYLTKKYPEALGIGKYKTFTHVDVRKKKARWVS